METSVELLSALDKSWNQFTRTWKKSRTKASEKSVHDLRVNTRRLMAALELTAAVCAPGDVRQLQRRLKKLLKGMGTLRDVQVQLELVSELKQIDVIAGFKRRLERRERREIATIQGELKRGRKRRLEDAFEAVRFKLSRTQASMSNEKFHRSVERFLSARHHQYLKAVQRFQRVQPFNEDAFHEMRIALKKLRYAVEAAEPLLGRSAREQARKMHTFQQLMGDSRDLEILRTELESWANKKGKKIAVVPVLDRLQSHREALLKRISESSDKLERVFETESAKPVVETTAIVEVPKTPLLN
jgi:CHAD domain-containing protein